VAQVFEGMCVCMHACNSSSGAVLRPVAGLYHVSRAKRVCCLRAAIVNRCTEYASTLSPEKDVPVSESMKSALAAFKDTCEIPYDGSTVESRV
jgi:hypothetical protein